MNIPGKSNEELDALSMAIKNAAARDAADLRLEKEVDDFNRQRLFVECGIAAAILILFVLKFLP